MDSIDRLLFAWHLWNASWCPVPDYPRDASFGGSYRSSRQWMTPGDLDDEVEIRTREHIAKIVDPLVMQMDLKMRVAINVAMRNFEAGAQVWTNPRWPHSQDADYAQAKAWLAPKLRAAGLLDRQEKVGAPRRPVYRPA